MYKINVKGFGDFSYTPSMLETFIEKVAKSWKLELTDLIPDCHNVHLERNSHSIDKTYAKIRKELIAKEQFNAVDLLESKYGIISYHRRLTDNGVHDAFKRMKYSDKDYITELYDDKTTHREEAEISRIDKHIIINFDPNRGYGLKVYFSEISRCIPKHKVRCVINTAVKHNIWLNVDFYPGKFEELVEKEGKSVEDIAINDTFSTINNYFGLKI
jgi:hypothetical protein